MTLLVAALAVGLVVWGSQPSWPARLDGAARRRAALWGLPLGIAAFMLIFAATSQDPDAALDVGLGPGWPASLEGRLVAVLLLAALASSALALVPGGEERPAAKTMAALLGLGGLLGFSMWGELLRIGGGPQIGAALFLAAILLRALVGLGAGQLLLPGRPRLALLGAVALLVYPFVLPAVVRFALERSGDWLTLAAAAALFLLAGFLPGRLARASLLAGAVLAAIFLARAVEMSQRLQLVWPELWDPPTGR
jgi:hypothetical protein